MTCSFRGNASGGRPPYQYAWVFYHLITLPFFDKKSFSGQQIQPQFPCSWIDIKNGQSVVTADLYLDVTDADGRLAPTDLRDLALPLEVNACKA